MKNEVETFTVLTEKQIVQKLAGYKSAYTKQVKAAKTARERKMLEAKREEFIGCIEHAIRNENRKAIQRRAGHLSWVTRRNNQAKQTEIMNEKKTAHRHTASKKVCRCSVHTKKR